MDRGRDQSLSSISGHFIEVRLEALLNNEETAMALEDCRNVGMHSLDRRQVLKDMSVAALMGAGIPGSDVGNAFGAA